MEKLKPEIGYWVYACCKEDLRKITTKEQLDEIQLTNEEFNNKFYRIFKTKKEALTDIRRLIR